MTFQEVQAALAANTPLTYNGVDKPGLPMGAECTVVKAALPAFVYVMGSGPTAGPVKVSPADLSA